ncbi:MAG: hypothetical protein LBJ65_11255 [Burkholderia sp.]|jgi:hypothetical protein|nr:hypothetical protein [Burkholderia sp.]
MTKAFNLAAHRGPEKRAILETIFLWITNDLAIFSSNVVLLRRNRRPGVGVVQSRRGNTQRR